jgi:hypothetical protein
MPDTREKYQQAWKKFKEKMFSLRKRRAEIVTGISEKLDQQKMEELRKKLNGDA